MDGEVLRFSAYRKLWLAGQVPPTVLVTGSKTGTLVSVSFEELADEQTEQMLAAVWEIGYAHGRENRYGAILELQFMNSLTFRFDEDTAPPNEMLVLGNFSPETGQLTAECHRVIRYTDWPFVSIERQQLDQFVADSVSRLCNQYLTGYHAGLAGQRATLN